MNIQICMLERLEVHGKVYEPVSVVAEAVSYSVEELTQLARDKVVPAAMIDSEWFVDRSAVTAVQKTHPSNAKRRTLANQKLNRAQTVKAVYATRPDNPTPHPLTRSLQAATVLTCGLLVGSLLYWSDQSGVDVLTLQAGALQASDVFIEGMKPVWSAWQSIDFNVWYEK